MLRFGNEARGVSDGVIHMADRRSWGFRASGASELIRGVSC